MLGQTKQKITSALKGAVDIVLPPRCIISGEQVEQQGMVSPEVWQGLDFIHNPMCSCCGTPFSFEVAEDSEDTHCTSCLQEAPAYDLARSCVRYNDTSRDLVLKFKRADQTLAVHCFIPWLKKSGSEMLEKADYIVPVPLHRSRLLQRRYNQSGILAQYLSKDTAILALLDGLKRMRATAVQGSPEAKSRTQNVKNAFTVPEKHIEALRDKTVVLIDDVYTSGATVQECAKALKKAGVRSVCVLTVARVVKD